MSCSNCSSEEAISPTICPIEGGRIGEGEDRRDTNSESDSRRRSRSPRNRSGTSSQDSRPKGSEPTAPVSNEDEETEIVIP